MLFLELGPRVHWSHDELWAGAPRSMGDHSGESEEVKTKHNEKAPTFHETLEAGVKDAGSYDHRNIPCCPIDKCQWVVLQVKLHLAHRITGRKDIDP